MTRHEVLASTCKPSAKLPNHSLRGVCLRAEVGAMWLRKEVRLVGPRTELLGPRISTGSGVEMHNPWST